MNVAISPISIWSVLALLREGAGGKTQLQLQKALHLIESTKDVRTTFRKVDSVLHDQNKGVEMDNAGAVFTDGTRPLKWQFEYLAEKIYQANVFPVNFSNPSVTVRYINRWVANITHNNIEQLVHEDDMKDPHLVIANGLFFKGQWATPFNVSNTSREKFYDDKGDELGEVMMMKIRDHFRYSYMSQLGAKIVELPYQGGQYSMFVMVPTSNTTLDIVLERLSMQPMEKIYDRLVAEDEEYPEAVIDVQLPRVVIHSDYVLNKALESVSSI
ncbi:Leukocyte elastase inhibitor A [Blattella germanica]|nr:Leukocyte elastase inhibitor A [Blattella germanica]